MYEPENGDDWDGDGDDSYEARLLLTPLGAALNGVSTRLYDEVMRAVLRILGDLDLTVCFDATGGPPASAVGAGEGDAAIPRTGTMLGAAGSPTAGDGAGRSGAPLGAGAGAGGADGGSGDDVWVGDVQLLSNMGVEVFRPRVVKDFELFLNTVEFCVHFVALCPHRLFRPWAYVFCRAAVAGSNRYPHISGYYKLLTVAMFACDSTRLFKGLRWENGGVVLTPSASVPAAAGVDDSMVRGCLSRCYQILAGPFSFMHLLLVLGNRRRLRFCCGE